MASDTHEACKLLTIAVDLGDSLPGVSQPMQDCMHEGGKDTHALVA